ncbi:MAG: hypothetical protein KME31_36450 [Tolypothrix carrinoi HA7290-LM1]|nr:hypothetical protein [Tolypothrix carrinoi HA7290-LM1]
MGSGDKEDKEDKEDKGDKCERAHCPMPNAHCPMTPDASSRQSRRQVLQAGKPVQRTASPTHWLPHAQYRRVLWTAIAAQKMPALVSSKMVTVTSADWRR